MAKTVAPVAVELKIKGGEKLGLLDRAFRDLSKQIKLSDADIRNATKGILEFAEKSGRSVATLKAQEKALKGLQDQAKIGGARYKELAEQISNLRSEINLLDGSAKDTGKSLAALIPSKVPEVFVQNMRARREVLQGLAADSQEYIEKLAAINRFERQQSVRESRSGVIAAAAAAQTGLPKTVLGLALPDTLAGLRQRATELSYEIDNLTIGSNEYLTASRELADVQASITYVVNGSTRAFKEYDDAQARAARRAEKLVNIARSGYGPGAAVPGTRDPVTGAMIASGYGPFPSITGRLANQPREASPLFKDIAGISGARQAAENQMMGRSYDQVAESIRNATKASNGSINSLSRQRSAWSSLRDGLDPTTRAYRQATREIEKTDRALEKLNRKRRRLSAGQLAQGVGAAVSGGIFGGPEGLIGGLAGLAVGGPGGAFAGAAFGAQVGQLRQAIGTYTEMSAEVDRLRLGLAAASNDFDEFTKSVRLTEEASKRLFIPVADTYRIMTQLRANTVELGISTEDTRKIFEGITASIYKTGGGLNEVQGAMRAVIQVLSKGAPQAEEIRGQLGERLPAAIIDFARSTGRTTDELAKAFQRSEVTLDEFVDFAKGKYDENSDYLDELATNAVYAGARYQKALEQVQLTTGRVFQATGSQLQDLGTQFLNFVNDVLEGAVRGGVLEAGPNYIVNQILTETEDVGAAIEKIKKEIIELESLELTGGNFVSRFRGGFFGELLIPGTDEEQKRRIDNLKEALNILSGFGDLTRQRDPIVEAAKEAAEEAEKAESRRKSFLAAIEQRENSIAQARIQLEERSAQIRERAVEAARKLEEKLSKQRLDREREIKDIRREIVRLEQDLALGAEEARAIAAGADPEIFRIQREIIELGRTRKDEEVSLERQLLDEQTETQKAIEEFKVANAKAVMDANADHVKRMGEIQQQYATTVAKIIEDGTGRAGERLVAAGNIISSVITRATARIKLASLGVSIDENGQTTTDPGVNLSEADKKIVEAQSKLYMEAKDALQDANEELAKIPTISAITAPAIDSVGVEFDDLNAKLRTSASDLESVREQFRALTSDFASLQYLEGLERIFSGISAPLGATSRGLTEDIDRRRGVLRLREEGFSGSEAERLFDLERERAQLLSLNKAARIAGLAEPNQDALAINAQAEETAKNIEESYARARDSILELENLAFGEQLRTQIADLVDGINELTSPINQVVTAANAIGDAFKNSFKSVIDGSSSAKQALADFFKSVGDYFLDMAAQIAAEALKLAALKFVQFIIGSFAGGGGSLAGDYSGINIGGNFGGFGSAPGSALGGLGFAQGGYVPGGFKAFSEGGIVSRPTVGLVGEGGEPEYIIPQSKMSAAMSRYSRGSRGGSVIPGNGDAVEGATMGGNSMGGPIDVRYSVERINNVDYVTADQFQLGMQRAAQQGAAEGERRTLRSLKNSPGTRRGVGM